MRSSGCFFGSLSKVWEARRWRRVEKGVVGSGMGI